MAGAGRCWRCRSKQKLHERNGKAITNFDHTLPPAQSGLARELLKDPYTFDFLSLSEAAQERDLERGLVEHIRQFLPQEK
jgi:predicted nuclease of restriction endonuclease-like (RecB) superfamily